MAEKTITEEDLVSIIVPVYNVEEYLHECLDSIVRQTYSNLQIIIVDDGSTDKSFEICEMYESKDSRIQVIRRKNGGLSAARNTGLEYVKGEWIEFVDSDDWIDSHFVEELMAAAKIHQADFAVCGTIVINTDENKETDVWEEREMVYHSSREITYSRLVEGYIKDAAWNKLFKASFLEKMKFKEGYAFEDQFFTLLVLDKTKKAVSINKNYYFYRQRPGSITNAKKTPLKNYVDLLEAAVEKIKFLDEYFPEHNYERKKSFFYELKRLYQGGVVQTILYKNNQNTQLKRLKKFSKVISFSEKEVAKLNKKEKFEIWCLKNALPLYCSLTIRRGI